VGGSLGTARLPGLAVFFLILVLSINAKHLPAGNRPWNVQTFGKTFRNERPRDGDKPNLPCILARALLYGLNIIRRKSPRPRLKKKYVKRVFSLPPAKGKKVRKKPKNSALFLLMGSKLDEVVG
jgi:hypothetical protein